MGHRKVTAVLSLAEGTVGLAVRVRQAAEDVRRHFTVALIALAGDPVMPETAPSTLADAVSAVAASHEAAATKWPHMLTVSR
ncbi:hypothetical protein [Streptomyces avermitilis]|uniref:hypothetical protein n=1 Tax=Streptomyces avermitilis TaxID=33903 RepID=UPI0033A10D2E